MRVVAAMSGGVDSSVAAARLVADGHEVTGVHLALKGRHGGTARGCGSASDVDDARAVAERLGIELQVWDFAERFQDQVVDHFVAEYAAGRTPNPCLRCNATIKFAALLDRAVELGYEAIGTGHYARVEHDPAGPVLRRAANLAKDQSYVLAVLRPDQLRRCLFPLGGFVDKGEVRAEASRLGLAEVAAKPDSTDICFIPDGDTQGFLARHLGEAPGEVVDVDGTVLGEHRGTHGFTVGQRRGLRLGVPAADGRPRFVLALEPDTRRVVVGPREHLAVTRITASSPNWLVAPAARRGSLQLRAHGAPVAGVVEPDGEGLAAVLDEPVHGLAAGQGLVLYDGDRVLVQGIVSAAA